jgi:hypothetical protein
MECLAILQQKNYPPLKWRGWLSNNGFRFWLDQHLCHLANIAAVDYEIYRAAPNAAWELAEIYGLEHRLDGEFFIYQARGFEDDDCPGLAEFIGAKHVLMTRAGLDVPRIPYRYYILL